MRAFTLIETSIYLALLMVLMLGTLSLSYATMERAQSDHDAVAKLEAWSFLERKIEWAMHKGSGVVVSPTRLSIESDLGLYVFTVIGDAIQITTPTMNDIPLMHLNAADSVTFSQSAHGVTVHIRSKELDVDHAFVLP